MRTRLFFAALAGATLLAGLADPAAGRATSTSGQAPATYTIRAGDTLWGIAQRYRTTVGALTAANGIGVNTVLIVGRRLVLPASTTATGRTAPPAPTTPTTAPAAPPATTAAPTPPAASTGAAGPAPAAPVPTPPPGTPAGLPVDLLRRPEALALVPVFRAAATEFGVPADLLMSLAYRESGWRNDARSASGAIGIGQLLPASVTWVATALLKEPSLDATVPAHNVRLSARLLRWMLDTFHGDARLALAAYFDGPGAVTRRGVSPLAERYAQSILARRAWFT